MVRGHRGINLVFSLEIDGEIYCTWAGRRGQYERKTCSTARVSRVHGYRNMSRKNQSKCLFFVVVMKGRGEEMGTSVNIDGGGKKGMCATQKDHLSCVLESVAREGDSGGGWLVLSSPFKPFLHTGHVSCCQGRRGEH